MEAACALAAAAPILESIPNPLGGAGWPWVGCGCHRVPIYRPNSNSSMGGIKLQLSCGVRIELAVGSVPYLARPGPSPYPLGILKVPSCREGALQTRQLLRT